MGSTSLLFSSHPVTFDLTDPAERFIVERMQFFHSDAATRCRVLAERRVEVVSAGRRHRLVLQAVRFQPARRGARPEWQLLEWDIDGPGVRFRKRPTRAAMLELFRSR